MVDKLLALLIGWKAKLIAFGAFALVVLGWIFKIKRESYNKGKEEVHKSIQKENERVKDGWQKIDNSPRDVDDALARLRKRSADKGFGS